MGFDLQVPEDFKEGIDEGWWESILADEESYLPAPVKAESRTVSGLDWERARRLFLLDEVVELTVSGYNRGGLLVEGKGLKGFVPYSHLVSTQLPASPPARDAAARRLIGKPLQLKVIECVPENSRVVFSERAAQAGSGRRQILFSMLEPGQIISGQVTNITDFGVFVDLGGVEGLIHISELSWGRVSHPAEVVQPEQTLRVLVLDLSPERCRVALSLKRLHPNPWENAAEAFPPGAVTEAEITQLVPYGAFARLPNGIEGLIHISQVPLPAGKTLRDVLQPGQTVRVRVLQLEPERQRLGLSLFVHDETHA